MELTELLSTIKMLAKNQGLSEPYIVGGYPRDKAFGFSISEVSDIDLTTGDSGSINLALQASKQWPTAHYRAYDDGHISLSFKNIQIDFSNNFNLPNIEEILNKNGIDNPTELEKEMYSRDFTINCLLQPLNLSQDVIDPIGVGKDDISAKLLRTPIDSKLTIGHDPRRILRALKLSLRFGLSMDDELKEAIYLYKSLIKDLPFANIKKQVNQMLKMDSKKTINLLAEYELLPILPLSKMMIFELTKNHMVQHILDG